MAGRVELFGCGCSVTSGSKFDAGPSISEARCLHSRPRKRGVNDLVSDVGCDPGLA